MNKSGGGCIGEDVRGHQMEDARFENGGQPAVPVSKK